VADRNRGGRSVDDDDSIDEPIDEVEFEDAFDEDVADEAPARRPRTAAGARARTVSRPKARTKEDEGPGFFGRILRFIREVVAELQKVIWPTRKELLTYTAVVIVFVAIVMSFVAGLDVGFARLMFLVFGTKTAEATP
jgi:preprotein translocase subunit SecE